ncbi:hypothetical protein OS493_038320 [Desmophyllum pertusum]|uniref:Uncharacterized protein n=1 Tax=Desmophyllum pertusum TaxID=174260 RepID=A0A9X0D060_9CNID|nr:hypothetical protein OS493_038320 [Desmophyllum pertusum]
MNILGKFAVPSNSLTEKRRAALSMQGVAVVIIDGMGQHEWQAKQAICRTTLADPKKSADTRMLLHAIDAQREREEQHPSVSRRPDTDVLVLALWKYTSLCEEEERNFGGSGEPEDGAKVCLALEAFASLGSSAYTTCVQDACVLRCIEAGICVRLYRASLVTQITTVKELPAMVPV